MLHSLDPQFYQDYAKFMEEFCRLRAVTDMTSELFRHILHHIVQKILSRHVNTSLSHEAHDNLVWNHDQRAKIEQYLVNGAHFKLNVFDQLVRHCLLKLAPTFRLFMYSQEGSVVRTGLLKSDAEGLYLNATMIQTAYRAHRARRFVLLKKHAEQVDATRKRLADISRYKK